MSFGHVQNRAKKKTNQKRFLPKFSLFCPFPRRAAGLECEMQRKTGLRRKNEADQKCYGLSGSLPGFFFPSRQYVPGVSVARGQKGSDTAPTTLGSSIRNEPSLKPGAEQSAAVRALIR